MFSIRILKMKWAITITVLLCLIATGIFGLPVVYRLLDKKYQDAHDPIRIQHIEEIAKVAMAYAEKVGYPPLYDLVSKQNKPFMVLIGRSDLEEDKYAKIDALKRGAMFVNSRYFEDILSKGLKTKIVLPRDPQTVATYAPNVYVYFVDQNQICVAAHLYSESDISQPYKWEGGTFHSHARCYKKKD